MVRNITLVIHKNRNSIYIALASEKKQKQVPYTRLQSDTSIFVGDEYLPTNITIKDPRNMHKDDIITLLRHIHGKQNTDGVENAFRFKVYIKEKEEVKADYPQVRSRIRARATLSPATTGPSRSSSQTATPGRSQASGPSGSGIDTRASSQSLLVESVETAGGTRTGSRRGRRR
jgi:hypothetical protein